MLMRCAFTSAFCLVYVHRGAVDHSRASLKPEIRSWATTGSRCETSSNSKNDPENKYRPRRGPAPVPQGRAHLTQRARGRSTVQEHSAGPGIIGSNERVIFSPVPCDRYAASGHPLPDLPPHRRLPARHPHRSPDRALPPGPSRSARARILVAGHGDLVIVADVGRSGTTLPPGEFADRKRDAAWPTSSRACASTRRSGAGPSQPGWRGLTYPNGHSVVLRPSART